METKDISSFSACEPECFGTKRPEVQILSPRFDGLGAASAVRCTSCLGFIATDSATDGSIDSKRIDGESRLTPTRRDLHAIDDVPGAFRDADSLALNPARRPGSPVKNNPSKITAHLFDTENPLPA